MEETRNVVLFGECGVGKSSVINTIVGRPVAETSNDVVGCTDENTSYKVTLETGVKINLWDTIGLDEGTAGRIPADLAKQRLKQFLQKQIASPEGVDLLLYCIRGASGKKTLPIKRGHWEKYKYVFEETCKRRVPIAMIVTYLESYDPSGDMEVWWDHNQERILEFGFQFCGHACVAVLPRELWSVNDDVSRIETSRCRLQDLLSRSFLPPRNVLLLGDCEDKDDLIDLMVASRNKQNSDRKVEGIPPFTCIPVAFAAHTHVNFWHLIGFDETNDDALVTEKNLKLLVQGIKQTAGIDLLVFCFRAGRIKIRHVRNYKLFYAAICRKKVAVAIVVLGPEEDADGWWQRNEHDIRRKGFHFDRHTYIPCDPCRLPRSDLDNAVRHQLVQVIQEEYTSGSWKIGNDAFWVTVPNVRAVVGELAWPTTTVTVCDTTRHGTFAEIAPGVRSSLRSAVNHRPEHQFQQVDPQSFLLIGSRSPGKRNIQSRISEQGSRSISLIMFFMSTDELDNSETWRTLERFYSLYKGSITPLLVVVCGVSERKLALDFWEAAPRHIRKRIGVYLAHYPGHNASLEAKAAAQDIIADMIQDRCLVDLGEKVGILQEILSVWRKYRSHRAGVSTGDPR